MRCAERRKFSRVPLGGGPGRGALAAEKLQQQFDLSIVGVDAPHVTKAGKAVDEDAVLGRIQRRAPISCWWRLARPNKSSSSTERWRAFGPAVAIGVGAGFDFVAGRLTRAPRWMSSSGFEWLYRLAQEPRRLARRYLIEDPKFLAILMRTMRLPKSERIIFRLTDSRRCPVRHRVADSPRA